MDLEEDTCDSCELTEDNCECVPCRSCGEKTMIEDIYQGRCPSCEDEQMVRSIR